MTRISTENEFIENMKAAVAVVPPIITSAGVLAGAGELIIGISTKDPVKALEGAGGVAAGIGLTPQAEKLGAAIARRLTR